MKAHNIYQLGRIVSTIFILTLFVNGNARANLVVNGGFEDPPVLSGSYILYATPTGWSGTVDLAKQGYAGAVDSGDGNQWLDLNPGTEAGTGISQDIFLDAGITYEFSFVYNGGGGGSTTEISFSLESGIETLFSDTVSTLGMDVYSGTSWITYTTTATPTVSGIQTLSFIPNGTYSGGFIDAVTLSAPIPLPAGVWLFGSGLIGLIGVARRKKS